MTERADQSGDSTELDPLRYALRQQGAAFGQQTSRLNTTAQDVEVLVGRVAGLLNQVTELQRELAISRSSEPDVNSPPLYDGDPNACQPFLSKCALVFSLQPRRYATEEARVAYVLTLLTGRAREWGTAVWDAQAPCCHSFSAFQAEMTQLFDRSARGDQEVSLLSCLTQGRSSVSAPNVTGVPEEYHDLCTVFCKSRATSLPSHRPYDCAIDLLPGTSPPKGRLYSLSSPEREAMDKYINESLHAGLIRHSSLPAGAGFFLVQKKDGSLRPCIDYRGLNEITVKNKYPLPLMSTAFELLQGAQVFTKLDVCNAYHLVRIHEGDEWKTAFNTPTGHYEYLVLPRLLENQLFVKAEKCEFHADTVSFLGHVISPRGVEPDSSKIAAPLMALTSTKVLFRWNPQAQVAFDNLKSRFVSAPVLCFPDPERQFIVEVDASEVGIFYLFLFLFFLFLQVQL
ncbi:hypothetical protein IRJ41_016491 [Triplophysa rosa]|uniref:ribonuclease H n=1 Tax=Triplophysa rosa TaxID=992332 RepID=A0A9W7WTR4_TRIRA|nr:hypothetical protein IRJ41_016491 [Triplophysa rosa]